MGSNRFSIPEVRMEDKVLFSKEQYEYLNKMFPEVIPSTEDSMSKVFKQAGTRQVVQFIKDRMR